MKYKFVSKKRLWPLTPLLKKWLDSCIYANERDNPSHQFKELVIEEKPNYNPETQELISWFENGEVITKKFKVVDKEVK